MHTPDTLPTTAPELHRLVLTAALAAPDAAPCQSDAAVSAAPSHITLRMGRLADGGRPMFRIINTRERLEAFAAQVAKRPALFGGGKINPPKARPMIDGDTRAARVAREALQDGDAQAAFELATSRAAGFFAAHGQNATLYMCPELIEISGHAWTLAIREDGTYRVMHPASLNTIATGYKTRARAIESARETLAQHAPERVAQEYAAQTPHNTTHARALWCVQHQVTDHAEQVRELIARAAADAAIEQAQESAAVAELGTVQTAAQPEESTAAELCTVEAVAELHAEGHAGGGACQSMGCVSVQTGAAPVARQGQTIAGKSGRWTAQFFNRDGLPCLQFTGPDGKPRESTHDTGRERMQALQAMARDADAQAQATPPELDPWQATAREVQALSAAAFEALHEHWEDINHHTAVTRLQCLRAGREDLATICDAIEREHLQAGFMSWHLSAARRVVAAAARGEDLAASLAPKEFPQAARDFLAAHGFRVSPDAAQGVACQSEAKTKTYDGCGRSRVYLASHTWTPTGATPAHQ